MLWLFFASGLNPSKAWAALRRLKTAEAVWNAGRGDLDGLDCRDISLLLAEGREARLDTLLALLKLTDIGFVSLESPGYPALLKEIYDPPPGLFYRGKLPGDELFIAVIGARDCTDYGRAASYRLSRDLAQRGTVIVSGMARGADGAAHEGALDAGGYTVAVCGTGLDECFPKENIPLYRRIVEQGCAVSEFPPKSAYHKANFPRRNRIISGLCHGLVVVEAAYRSGTSITVTQALDQGREVFAVPGNIYSELSSGTNQMIKDGAVPVTCWEDVLSAFRLDRPEPDRRVAVQNKESPPEPEREPLTGAFKTVFDCLDGSPISRDELAARAALPVQELLYALTMLEIDGYIKLLPGGMTVRN